METGIPSAPMAPTVRHFTTDSAPRAERSALFQREMHRLFAMNLSVSTSAPRPLSAQIVAYRGRSLHAAALRLSPHSTAAVPAAASGHSRLLVSLHKEGTAVVAQGGRENRIEPGDVFVIDPARPFCIETGEVHSHSVYLPTSALRRFVPQLDDVTALPIRGNGGPAAAFRATLEALFTSLETLQDPVADCIGEALPALLAAAFVSSAAPCAPSRLRQLHRRRIVRYVHDHLGDPQLDALAVARGVCLSLRHLNRLFAEEGNSLMKWVWAERLERCASDLRTHALMSMTIAEVAYRWGFSHVSHFSRAFKLRFGMSPRAWRSGAALS
ncbi:MAG: helix-turn-helix domain-containing protein [Rubrivivax sp.]|nr:helix-turn-helix domain-containing protein [Rubrivivax sp.]